MTSRFSEMLFKMSPISRRRIAAVVCLLGLSFIYSKAPRMGHASEQTAAAQMEIVAHRGASFDAPENTMAAFKLGWEQQADAVLTPIGKIRGLAGLDGESEQCSP